MNCYLHNDESAVATCANGCGRGLCPDCAGRYGQPLCDLCAAEIQNVILTEEDLAVSEARAIIIKRMVLNAIVLAGVILYFIILNYSRATVSSNPATSPNPYIIIGLLCMVPTFIWGFATVNRWTHWLSDVTGWGLWITIRSFLIFYFIASMFIGALSVFIIPIMLIADAIRLFRVRQVSRSAG